MSERRLAGSSGSVPSLDALAPHARMSFRIRRSSSSLESLQALNISSLGSCFSWSVILRSTLALSASTHSLDGEHSSPEWAASRRRSRSLQYRQFSCGFPSWSAHPRCIVWFIGRLGFVVSVSSHVSHFASGRLGVSRTGEPSVHGVVPEARRVRFRGVRFWRLPRFCLPPFSRQHRSCHRPRS